MRLMRLSPCHSQLSWLITSTIRSMPPVIVMHCSSDSSCHASHAAVNMSRSTLLTHHMNNWMLVNATCYNTALQFKYQYCRLSLHQWSNTYHILDWLSELHAMGRLWCACMQMCHRGAQHDMGFCSVMSAWWQDIMSCAASPICMHASCTDWWTNENIFLHDVRQQQRVWVLYEYCFSLANFFSFCICKKNLTLNMKVRWVIWLTLHLIRAKALLNCSAICEFKPAYAGYWVKVYVLEHAVCPNQWNLSTRNKVSLKWCGCLLRQ